MSAKSSSSQSTKNTNKTLNEKVLEMETIHVETVLPKLKHSATVIFSHGLGGNGNTAKWVLHPILHRPELAHIKFVFPSAPVREVEYLNRRIPSWYDIKGVSLNFSEDTKGIQHSTQLIHKLIEKEMKETGIPSNRIAVAGISQGGALSLYAGLTFKQSLAGILSVSGYLPLATSFVLNYPKQPRATPILMTHGKKDTTVPYVFGNMSFMYLKSLLLRNANMKSYPDLDHYSVSEEMENDILDFLIKCVGQEATIEAREAAKKPDVKIQNTFTAAVSDKQI